MNDTWKHRAGVALALTLAILTALEKMQPAWGAGLTLLVALVTDLQAAFGKGAPPVAGVLALLAGISWATLPSCAHVPAPVVATASCVEHQADVERLLPTIAQDLAAADYVGALAAVVQEVGVELVKCAVQEFVSQHSPDVKASADPLTARQVSNGNAWLAAH